MLSYLISRKQLVSIIILATFSGFGTPSAASDGTIEDTFAKSFDFSRLHRQPQLLLLKTNQEQELIEKAKQGDRQAKDQLIGRNYWGFIDKKSQCSLWGDGGRNGQSISILTWGDIEN